MFFLKKECQKIKKNTYTNWNYKVKYFLFIILIKYMLVITM